MTKIQRVFVHADMRCSHDGLAEIAKKEGIDVKKLEPGTFLLFINSAHDRLKMYGADNVLAYMKLPKGSGRMDLRTIAKIPASFVAKGKIDYDAAIKDVILEELYHLKPARPVPPPKIDADKK